MNTLFQNVTAVLMDPAHTVLENAFVAVEGGRIASVGAQRPEGSFDRVIDGRGGILMPGLKKSVQLVPPRPVLIS